MKNKCLRCGYEWKRRKVIPKYCAKCNSSYWNKPRLERINVGKSNGMWKGDKVGRTALHDYVKYYVPKPNACQCCGNKKRLDLANISQEYKRDLTDWEWLCRKCHMNKDGRAVRLRFTGHKHTPSSLKKMSLANKGVPKSPEHKAKIRASLLTTLKKKKEHD